MRLNEWKKENRCGLDGNVIFAMFVIAAMVFAVADRLLTHWAM